MILQQPVLRLRHPCRLVLRARQHPGLIGFQEFGEWRRPACTAENITSQDDNVTLMVGVDTQVVHGFVNCNATGAITGIGNALATGGLLQLRWPGLARRGVLGRLGRELESAPTVACRRSTKATTG